MWLWLWLLLCLWLLLLLLLWLWLQVIDEFVDRGKLPLEQSDLVFEEKLSVNGESDVDRVMTLFDGLLEDGVSEDEDETDVEDGTDDESKGGVVGKVLDKSGLKVSYVKGDVRVEGLYQHIHSIHYRTHSTHPINIPSQHTFPTH